MTERVERILGRGIFGYWLFVSIIGVLTSAKIMGRFGWGVVVWWIGLGALALASVSMLIALSRKDGAGDMTRFMAGVVTGIAAVTTLIVYFFVHPDIYSAVATQPNQLMVLFACFLGTTVYCLWDNELVRPMSFKELRALAKAEHDPTKIDMDFNNRIFRKRDDERQWTAEEDDWGSEDTVVIPVVTDGSHRTSR